jgi:hypothetical protein
MSRPAATRRRHRGERHGGQNTEHGTQNKRIKIPYSEQGREKCPLYNGANLRVWYKKDVSHREHRGHREEVSRCWVKS